MQPKDKPDSIWLHDASYTGMLEFMASYGFKIPDEWDNTKKLLKRDPHFEIPASVYQWKSHMDFSGDTAGYRNHGVDYLHAYWFGRRAGLLSGAE